MANQDFSETVEKGYTSTYNFKLYLNGEPYVLLETDIISALVGAPGIAAAIVAEEWDGVTPPTEPASVVEIVSVGQVNAAPAEIRIRLGSTDTADLEIGTTYQFDVILTDTVTGLAFLLQSGALTVRDVVRVPVEP